MPQIDLSPDEYEQWLEFRGQRTPSPERVLAGLIGQIREQLELSGMDIISLAKKVGMQPYHVRTILSIDKPSDPKLTTVVKIMSGLNMSLKVGEIQ